MTWWPPWVAWRRRRARRRLLEQRVRDAERAARRATQQWPEVHRVANQFALDVERAMRRNT